MTEIFSTAQERLETEGSSIAIDITLRFISYLDYIAKSISDEDEERFELFARELSERCELIIEGMEYTDYIEAMHQEAHLLAEQQFKFRNGEMPTDNLRHPGFWD